MAATSKRTIENWQIKRMWTLAGKLNMKKDELYLMADVSSLHRLYYHEANDIIAMLSVLLNSGGEEKPACKTVKKMDMSITDGQEKKVWKLMYELESLDLKKSETTVGKRLIGIIQKELNITAGIKEPFAWVDYDNANKLIEALKGYIRSAKKRQKGGNDGKI